MGLRALPHDMSSSQPQSSAGTSSPLSPASSAASIMASVMDFSAIFALMSARTRIVAECQLLALLRLHRHAELRHDAARRRVHALREARRVHVALQPPRVHCSTMRPLRSMRGLKKQAYASYLLASAGAEKEILSSAPRANAGNGASEKRSHSCAKGLDASGGPLVAVTRARRPCSSAAAAASAMRGSG